VPLQLPPLRERREDIPLLVEHIISKFNERLKKSVTGLTAGAMANLCERWWPGNIRELENVIERTILFCKGEQIDSHDLPGSDTGGSQAARPAVQDVGESLHGDTSLKEIVRARASEVERELICQALDETGGNVTQAAKLLKISRKSLQMKMKEFGLRDRENGS